MEQKNKNKEKLTTKKLTKIFSLIWFGLVFVFTFCLTSNEIRNNPTNMAITAGVVFGTLGLSIIVWLVWFLILRKKNQTPNDKKIQEAIKKESEKELKEKEQDK